MQNWLKSCKTKNSTTANFGIGIALGVAIRAALNNYGAGIAIGVAIALALNCPCGKKKQ